MIRFQIRAVSLLLLVVLAQSASLRAQNLRTIDFSEGLASAHPTELGFAFGGKMAFAVVRGRVGDSDTLFSFSPLTAQIIDAVDLAPDFGVRVSPSPNLPQIFLKVHPETGLLALYGRDVNFRQKVVAFRSDPDGRLRKLWDQTFSVSFIFDPTVAFNSDGSRIFFAFRDEQLAAGPDAEVISESGGHQVARWTTPAGEEMVAPGLRFRGRSAAGADLTVLMLRAESGKPVERADLEAGSGFLGGIFDPVNERYIVSNGDSLFVLAAGKETLALEAAIGPTPDVPFGGTLIGVTRDGRFALVYVGFSVTKGINVFLSYDLLAKDVKRFDLINKFALQHNLLAFHEDTGTLLVPLVGKIFIDDAGRLVFDLRGTRKAAVIMVATDGVLSESAEVLLPERSAGNTLRNLVDIRNNASVSGTGAIGFLSALNGRLFAFDTLTGEVVGDDLLDPANLSFLQFQESLGLVVAGNEGHSLLLREVVTRPVIESVKVSKRRTIIRGANFLEGARVEIDGQDRGLAVRAAEDPSRQISLPLGLKAFVPGSEITLVVVNRDGRRSDPARVRL